MDEKKVIDKTSTMRCPLCNQRLHTFGTFEYEDCIQQEFTSEKFMCITESCPLSRKVHWNDIGETWSGDIDYKEFDNLFPDDKYAPINSSSKRQEVEIYKRGLKDRYDLSAALCLWYLKPYIDINYKGNEAGEVLGKKYSLRFLKKDKDRLNSDYCIMWTGGLKSLYQSIKWFHQLKKNTHVNKWDKKRAIECQEPLASWDKRWWRRVYKWYVNLYKIK